MIARRAIAAFPIVGTMMLSLVACQAVEPAPPPSGKSASLRVMEQVATAAHECWFASGDETFRSYRMANELDSYSGRPRFLIVPVTDFAGLPLLVVQAAGSSSNVEVFGPLMQKPLAARISTDIQRWRTGDDSCA